MTVGVGVGHTKPIVLVLHVSQSIYSTIETKLYLIVGICSTTIVHPVYPSVTKKYDLFWFKEYISSDSSVSPKYISSQQSLNALNGLVGVTVLVLVGVGVGHDTEPDVSNKQVGQSK